MRRLRFLVVYALAWTPFTALYALILAAGVRQRLTVADSIVAAIWTAAPAALLGLGAWYAAGRTAGASRARAAAVHGVLALAFTTLWAAVVVAQIAAFASRDAFAEYLKFGLSWQVFMGLAAYGVLVGARLAADATRRARERDAAAARAEALRARAELQALRARLDPHFLFNTLHSVTALVRVEPARAEQALERFAELLRFVLDVERRGRDDVPLADELAFVRTYLELERLRLGDRLRVEELVDPDALECVVPALTLQPLVENAIRHGLAPIARGGTLRLAAAFDGDALVIEVGDDGAGASGAGAARDGGIGLATVRQRLAARFPGAADVRVVTAPGEGFVVRLRLPAVPHSAAGPHAAPNGERALEATRG
jgi:hypothetical protein